MFTKKSSLILISAILLSSPLAVAGEHDSTTAAQETAPSREELNARHESSQEENRWVTNFSQENSTTASRWREARSNREL